MHRYDNSLPKVLAKGTRVLLAEKLTLRTRLKRCRMSYPENIDHLLTIRFGFRRKGGRIYIDIYICIPAPKLISCLGIDPLKFQKKIANGIANIVRI